MSDNKKPPAKSTSQKKVFERVKLLSTFLNDNSTEVVNEVEKELLKLSYSDIPLIKELKNDITDDTVCVKLDSIIKTLQQKEIQNKLMDWGQEQGDVFTAMNFLSEIYMTRHYDVNAAEVIGEVQKRLFLAINEETTSVEALQLLQKEVYELVNVNSSFAKSYFFNFINTVFPEKLAYYVADIIIGKSLAERLSLPVAYVSTGAGFVLGFKNEGPFKIGFIEAPFLMLVIPSFKKVFDMVSYDNFKKHFQEAVLKETDNVSFFLLMLDLIAEQMEKQKKHDDVLWINGLKNKMILFIPNR